MTHRVRIAIVAVVLIVFGVFVLSVCVHHDAADDPSSTPSLLHYDDAGLWYTYHVNSGDEGLFNLAADPKMLKNLAHERPDDLRRLRDELTKRVKAKYGVDSLEELGRRPDVIDRMRGHQYFGTPR